MAWVLTVFILMTIVNVILNTARVLITVKGGMFLSALISAAAFGFYTIMTILTIDTKSSISPWVLALVTAVVNFIGVYVVKYAEIWIRKDRLWIVDVVIYAKNIDRAKDFLNKDGIRFTELPISNSDSRLFHIYSETQDDSKRIRALLDLIGAKYFVSESKHL